jgi:hypothetical protein
MLRMIEKIVSGAQTGADRAALDVALELGITTGGWIPCGRLAEDGTVPAHYPNLVETDSSLYASRTELNVRDSDATVIFSFGPLTGGSALTEKCAHKLSKPSLILDLDALGIAEAIACFRAWLGEVRPRVLNVAGPRLSKAPRIADATGHILREVLCGPDD